MDEVALDLGSGSGLESVTTSIVLISSVGRSMTLTFSMGRDWIYCQTNKTQESAVFLYLKSKATEKKWHNTVPPQLL